MPVLSIAAGGASPADTLTDVRGAACILVCVLCATAGMAGACASSDPPPPRVDAPSASARIDAMAAVTPDASIDDLDALIRSLESDDDLVRASAICTLRRVTGQSLDFDAHGTASQRAAAVSRWRAWLEARREAANTSPAQGARAAGDPSRQP